MDLEEQRSLAASIMGKLSAIKSPRPREYYQAIQKKSVAARKRNARLAKKLQKSSIQG